MKESHLFYIPGLPECKELPPEEAGHAVRVLRVKDGDPLLATDGRGNFYDCIVTAASPRQCEIRVSQTHEVPRLWHGGIWLAVAPTKNMDRMEWLVEKATDIGMDGVTFVNCRNSERKVVKIERIEKIVVSALKQSHKALKPEVGDMENFKSFIQQPFNGTKFIAHCLTEDLPALYDQLDANSDSLVLIGPEGDFTPDEVHMAEAAGFRSVSLGKSRLRTETAALVAVHQMNLKKAK